jgi:hypothetical protein
MKNQLKNIRAALLICGVISVSAQNMYAGNEERIGEQDITENDSPAVVQAVVYPFKLVLNDIEAIGSEIINYSQADLTLRNVLKPERTQPKRIWHSPAVFLLATPKWATHWFHNAGRKIIDREVVDEDENVFVAVPAGIAGGILYIMGAGEIPSHAIGIIVRDLARLAKLEPFRRN